MMIIIVSMSDYSTYSAAALGFFHVVCSVLLHFLFFLKCLNLIFCCCICWLVSCPGSQLSEFTTKSAVRTCGLSFSGNLVMYTTDKAMSQPCEMLVYDLRDEGQMSKFRCFVVVGHIVLSVWCLLQQLAD